MLLLLGRVKNVREYIHLAGTSWGRTPEHYYAVHGACGGGVVLVAVGSASIQPDAHWVLRPCGLGLCRARRPMWATGPLRGGLGCCYTTASYTLSCANTGAHHSHIYPICNHAIATPCRISPSCSPLSAVPCLRTLSRSPTSFASISA